MGGGAGNKTEIKNKTQKPLIWRQQMGKGHLERKTEGRQQQGWGHRGPIILSLGHNAPFRLPLWGSALHSQVHKPVTLSSLVPRAMHWHFQVRRGTWGPNWESEEGCGNQAQPPPGSWRIIVTSFPTDHSGGIPSPTGILGEALPTWGACDDFYTPMAESSNPIFPNCQLSTPMGSKCNPVGPKFGGLLGSGVPSQDFLPLQSPEARQAGAGQYWGAGAPDLPGASSLVWDFICWTYFCVCEHFTLLFWILSGMMLNSEHNPTLPV